MGLIPSLSLYGCDKGSLSDLLIVKNRSLENKTKQENDSDTTPCNSQSRSVFIYHTKSRFPSFGQRIMCKVSCCGLCKLLIVV